MVHYHNTFRTCVFQQVSLPPEIRQFVQASTGNYGKVKLVLQRNAFFVESPYPEVLHTLLQVLLSTTHMLAVVPNDDEP